MDVAISVRNLSKSYRLYNSPSERLKELLHPFKKTYHREFCALKDVSFDIKRGEKIGIIGRNGSGKSTLLQLLCGIIPPTTGETNINGRVTALLELGAGFNKDFSGRENVYMNGALMGFTNKEMDEMFPTIAEFAEIGDFIDQPVKTYSSGMYIRLAFATAINLSPDILILDEVLAVGDIAFQNKCLNMISNLVESENTTILFVSHDINSMRLLCDRCLLLDKGKLIMDGSPIKVIDYYKDTLIDTAPPCESNVLKLSLLDEDNIAVENVECKGTYSLAIEMDNIEIKDGLMLAFSFVNLDNQFSFRLETDKFKYITGTITKKKIRVYFKELNLPKGNYTIRLAVSDGSYINRKYFIEETIIFRVKDSIKSPNFLQCEWEEDITSNKKIGLIGWWGGKNEGDQYILQNLKKMFGDSFELHPMETPFNINSISLKSLNNIDFIIVGGGGLFTTTPPRPFDTFDKWKDQLNTPLGVISVGVQEIAPEYEDVIRQIVKKSKFFYVRDKGSFDLVKIFSPKVCKMPDLTFLYPRKVIRKKTANAIGVNLRIWNFDEKRTYDNTAWCDAINALQGEKETVPLSFMDGLKDIDAMKNIKGKHNATFNIQIYENLKVMIGMRLHSLIFAIQNAIPVIGIAYTPKVRRLFQEAGLEEFCLGTEEYGRLSELYNELIKRYDEVSEQLEKYTMAAKDAVSSEIENIKKIINHEESE